MNRSIGALWQQAPPDDAISTLRTVLERHPGVRILFRADDIAEVDEPFRLLMELFHRHRMPLCLAMVPGWLTKQRWQAIHQFDPEHPLWCWHQHGFAHINHARSGKKTEFGDNRGETALFHDIQQGRERLATLLGPIFFPVFTPPWNRCGHTTLDILKRLDFYGISRFSRAQPPAPQGLKDIEMNIDLHTGRETDWQQGWYRLLDDCSRAAATGTMGIMIHHQRMNREAFRFLEDLLLLIKATGSTVRTFRELLA